MFTKADHAKAVELYKRCKDAEWWPANTHWNDQYGEWQRNIDGNPHWSGNELEMDHALAVIAWAMVDKLKVNVMLGPGASIYDSSGTFIVRTNWHVSVGLTTYARDTPFLALAAAIEDQK